MEMEQPPILHVSNKIIQQIRLQTDLLAQLHQDKLR